tara:strand:- start:105 stop:1031 length:927 start_codon:yes stop_codon:yes gene_type:complete
MKPIITAQSAVVPFGPIELEGFLLPDGEFRQSLKSTARALGMPTGVSLTRQVLPSLNRGQAPGENPSSSLSLTQKEGDSAPQYQILEIDTTFAGPFAKAHTLDLTTVVAVWGWMARSGSKYADRASQLLEIGARVSLEGAYREAFGMAADGRSMEEQLLHAWLDLEALKRRPMIDRQFANDIHRITGHSFYGKNPYMAIVIDELIWSRIPETVMDQMRDLNPVVSPMFTKPDGTPVGYRRYAYSQLLSDEAFRNSVMPIATAAKAICAAAPDKTNGGYRWVLQALDRTFPRNKKRGSFKPSDQIALEV